MSARSENNKMTTSEGEKEEHFADPSFTKYLSGDESNLSIKQKKSEMSQKQIVF